jgi:glutaredoxin
MQAKSTNANKKLVPQIFVNGEYKGVSDAEEGIGDAAAISSHTRVHRYDQ